MRKKKILEKSREIIEEGNKPSVQALSDELGYHPANVHRILNSLEKEDRVETYSKNILGRKLRMIGLKRE